jgi:hypothetical protein
MPEIKPVGAGDWVRMMLYAFPGWGKTSFLATAAEAGMKTLIIRTPMDQVPKRALRSGADEVVVTTWEDMMGNSDSVLDVLRFSDHGYEWVWWDNISVDQDVLLDDVWAATVDAKPARAYKLDGSGNKAGLNLSPTSGMDKGEYGRNMERIQQFIRHIVGINTFHFGITAHPVEGPHPTKEEGGDLLQPWIQGRGMIPKICGYMNVIGFMELKDGEEGDLPWRQLHLRENARFYAKDLYDAFPEGYLGEENDQPTMAAFMAAIEAAKGDKPVRTARRGATPARRRGAQPSGRRRGRREQ